MQKPLKEEFNETVSEAYEAFPKELKRLVALLLLDEDTSVFTAPEIADTVENSSTAIIELVINARTRWLKENSSIGVAQRGYNLCGLLVDLIALNGHLSGDYTERFTEEMDVIWVLDHEIGHLILKNGYLPTNRRSSSKTLLHLQESAADAYAMLRHIQRYGKHTDHAGHRGEDHAAKIVLAGDASHYTTDAVERAWRAADEMGEEFFNLSLQEIAAKAEEIAHECQINNRTLRKVRRAFRPLQKLYKSDKSKMDNRCRKVLSVMKKRRRNPDIFKAGKRYLNRPGEKNFMTEAAKTDPYWQEALDFIDNHQVKPRCGILQRISFKRLGS